MASDQTLRAIITVLDKTAAPFRAINERIERLGAPLRHIGDRLTALAEETGLRGIASMSSRFSNSFIAKTNERSFNRRSRSALSLA
jgi:hypothetical protein